MRVRASRLRRALTPTLRRALELSRRVAAEHGAEIWLVGGPVRDLLLGRKVEDLDLAVRGDVPTLAAALAEEGGGWLRQHPRFGTASVRLPEGTSVDLAALRRERYVRGGALPEVEPARDIREDLARRDFSINAMALVIGGEQPGTLIDPFAGVGDLAAGTVRVLHDACFRDDPTRILRALRFAGRFGFDLEEQTGDLMLEGLRKAALSTVSGIRLGSEIRALLSEPLPLPGLLGACAAGLFEAVPSQGLTDPDDPASVFAAAADAVAWYRDLSGRAGVPPLEGWIVFWLALESERAHGGLEEAARYLELGERAVRASREIATRRTTLTHFLERPYHASDSALYTLLSPMLPETLAAAVMRSAAPQARGRLERFLTRLLPQRPLLSGADLLAMGAAEGPRVGEVLERVFCAQLDGLVGDREEALAEARRLVEGWEAD